MNCWAFPNSFFREAEVQFKAFVEKNIDNEKAEFYIPTVVENLMEQGKVKVKVLECGAHWMGITYKEDKPVVIQKIKSLIASNIYPQSLLPSKIADH